MKNKIYHIVLAVLKSNRKIEEIEARSHIYMTTHFPGLVQAFQ